MYGVFLSVLKKSQIAEVYAFFMLHCSSGILIDYFLQLNRTYVLNVLLLRKVLWNYRDSSHNSIGRHHFISKTCQG